MKQVPKTLALMTALCLTLCSCSGGTTPVDRAAEIQEEYTAIDSLTVTAEVTADYGDRVYEFRLKYTGDDEEGTVEILSPESVKGIAARLTSGGRALRYDGAELSLGSLTKDGLSPMECLPFMIGRWKNGYVSGAVTEKLDGTDTVAVTFDVSENESLVTWFEADSSLPVRAELFFDGDMVIRCEFENIIT